MRKRCMGFLKPDAFRAMHSCSETAFSGEVCTLGSKIRSPETDCTACGEVLK